MKVRMLIPLFLAALMILSARAALGGMQLWSIDLTPGDGLPQGQPSSLPLSSAEAIRPSSTGATVLITSGGLDPIEATIVAGQAVTWINQTDDTLHLVSGYAVQLYLPVVMCDAGDLGSTTAAAAASRVTVNQATWGGEINPGGFYVHTFTETGTYPYYIADHPDWRGRVLVQSPPADADLKVNGEDNWSGPAGSDILISLTNAPQNEEVCIYWDGELIPNGCKVTQPDGTQTYAFHIPLTDVGSYVITARSQGIEIARETGDVTASAHHLPPQLPAVHRSDRKRPAGGSTRPDQRHRLGAKRGWLGDPQHQQPALGGTWPALWLRYAG